MSSIVGLLGNFKGNDIVKMLKVSKFRGFDASGIFLDDIKLNIDLDKFNNDSNYSIGLGHNLLSIHDSEDKMSKTQPIAKDNLILVFDGVLYNFKTIKNFLNKVGIEDEINSDGEALLYLIDFYNKSNLVKAIKSAVHLIDGDYSFAIWDGKNLAIKIGRAHV